MSRFTQFRLSAYAPSQCEFKIALEFRVSAFTTKKMSSDITVTDFTVKTAFPLTCVIDFFILKNFTSGITVTLCHSHRSADEPGRPLLRFVVPLQ